MGPSDRCRAWTSCSLPHHHHHYHHHHHHHRHHLIFFPLHYHHHHHYLNCNSRVNFNFAHHPPQYLQPAGAVPLQNEADITLSQDDAPMLQEQDHEGLEDVGEKDDDEPIFVLTDEWREFFAASEAKRKLEKKKAKKKKQK